ncbi:pentatricopeptide repeat-containing protein [Panicum miliaceum]|uniref:Pentatricopeptide repeat-containing protein n=1 Tax=Panicum miliaceum TaxID=4540 RepID=A0A3L6S215_PANMI|nr:pentatricopeptide repeat-containing protein [Panicum miliaceum]
MDAPHCPVRRHLPPPLQLAPFSSPTLGYRRRVASAVACCCSAAAGDQHQHQERPWESYDRDIQTHAGSDLSRSLGLLADMQAAGARPSAAAYARLIRALGRAGRTLEAEALLLEMRRLGPRPDAAHYNALLEGLLVRAHLRLADRLLLQMADDGVARNRRTYMLLLDAYARAGRLEDSWWVLGEMRRRGIRLDTAGYSMLVRLYRDNGMWKKATDLVIEMQELGVELDVKIYNGLIDTFGKYGQLADARRVFDKMRAEGIKPDISTWNALILWHCRVGNMKRALRFFTSMQEEGMYPDPKIFVMIISRLGEQGKWDDIKRLFDGMKNRGFKESGAVYAVLVDIYGQYGHFRDAHECIAALKAENTQLLPRVFCVLANAYAQQGLCEQSVNVLQLMEEEGFEPNLVMLNLLINAFGTAGRHLEALAVFQHIKDTGMSPDVVTYTTLMKTFMRAKKFEKVSEVYKEMERAGCTPDRKAREMLHDASVILEQRGCVNVPSARDTISLIACKCMVKKSSERKHKKSWFLRTTLGSTKVSPRLYPAVIDSKKIREQNWCELLIQILKQSRQSDPKKHSFKPCLTFLMILYLDSLDTGFKRIPTRGCRASVWTINLVRKVIAKDTKRDGSFGALQFTGQDNILFGHHVPLEDFISTHVPESCGHQYIQDEVPETQDAEGQEDKSTGLIDFRQIGADFVDGNHLLLKLTRFVPHSNDDLNRGVGHLSSEVTTIIQLMDLHTTFVDKVMSQDFGTLQGLGIDLAETIPKLKVHKRKGEDTTIPSPASRNTKIGRAQGQFEETTPQHDIVENKCSSAAVCTDEPPSILALREGNNGDNWGRILSFNTSSADNTQINNYIPLQQDIDTEGAKFKSCAQLSFDVPTFDLGFSSQENNSQQLIASSRRFRRVLQLPPRPSRSADQRTETLSSQPQLEIESIALAVNADTNSVKEAKSAADLKDIIAIESQSYDDGSAVGPLVIGSESQEEGIQNNPINVRSQSQENHFDMKAYNHEGYISDDALLELDKPIINLVKKNKSNKQKDNTSSATGVLYNKGTKEAPLILPDGITPVPHVRHQTVTKPGVAKRSPYIDYTTKQAYIVPKHERDTYNQIVQYGSTKRTKKNT